jgi:hypothetical protein
MRLANEEALFDDDEEDVGRFGKCDDELEPFVAEEPFADEAEAEPQEALREAEERDDCAVDDFNFNTLEVDFGAAAG